MDNAIKVAVFSSKSYDKTYLEGAKGPHDINFVFLETRLSLNTTFLAKDYDVVCCFVNDDLTREILIDLASYRVKMVAMRCAGYNNVDLKAARDLDIAVKRVPGYSPHAVAEHAVGLIMDLNRNIHRAHNRVREGDFSLQGLMGFDLYGKTVGVIGTGLIGHSFARIMAGFGAKVVGYDPVESDNFLDTGGTYVELYELFRCSDVISMHCPYTPETHHMINQDTMGYMKRGVMLINTSRGGLINTKDVISALKTGQLGYLGLDVYEEESGIFFEDLSDTIIQDDLLARLMTFPNVTITSHQGFFTHEAMQEIAKRTVENIASI